MTSTTINSLRGSKSFGLNPNSRLWKSVALGDKTLLHRVALAPLTRYRALGHSPNKLHVEYYEQRATEGGLLVTEATFISKAAGGYPHAPGIYTADQIKAWKAVTDAVHKKGGIIYVQLWAIGRANSGAEPDVPITSASNIPFEGGSIPIPLTLVEIAQFMKDYKFAAKCAMEAGFDGCEVHGAHGYLPDQFLQTSSNIRTDIYGGSLENRARFMLEAVQAVSSVVGDQKTAVRISPFSEFQGMGISGKIFETFGYVCRELVTRHPRLAYVSITDPRLESGAGGSANAKVFSTDYFRSIFRGIKKEPSHYALENEGHFDEPTLEYPTVVLAAGGFTASDAEPSSDRTGDLIGYGRIFIPNPDLVHRLRHGLVLEPYNRHTFYTQDAEGYTTYKDADATTEKFVGPVTSKEEELAEEVMLLRKSFGVLKLEKLAVEHELELLRKSKL